MLTHARLLEALDYDPTTGIFRWKINPRGRSRPGDVAGTRTKRGYIHICLDQHLYLGHRLAWFYSYKVWPVKLDHRDKLKWRNAINNLREATQSQNMINVGPRTNNTTGYVGVVKCANANRYMARIKHNYKAIYLGLYKTPEEASAAYQAKARELFGEFAS